MASIRKTKKRLAHTFAKAVTCAIAMRKWEDKLNSLSKGKPCEILTGSGIGMTVSDLASCVPTMGDNFRDAPEWSRSSSPATFKKD